MRARPTAAVLAALLLFTAASDGAAPVTAAAAAPLGEPRSEAPYSNESDPPSSPAPEEGESSSVGVMRLAVLGGGFAVVFLLIGIAFYRMVRRSRLD